MSTYDDILVEDTISADTIAVGDQLVIDDQLVRVRFVDKDRPNIDEVFIRVENLSDPYTDEFTLYADDYYDVWYI